MRFLSIFIAASLLVLGFSSKVQAQNNGCESMLGSDFISDGHEHVVEITNGTFTNIDFVFYPHFRYRIVICSIAGYNGSIEWQLSDNKRKIIFTNRDKINTRVWDFEFSAILDGKLEVKLADPKKQKEKIRILVAYRLAEKNNPML
jgi:hypothetical protein